MTSLLADMTERLIKKGFARFSIEEGINNLIEKKQDSIFFPTMDVIIETISLLEWKIRSRFERVKKEFAKNKDKNNQQNAPTP